MTFRNIRPTLLTLSALCGGMIASASASAATPCNQGDLAALNVDGVTIVTASPVAATTNAPAYCDVIGTLNTSGDDVPPGSAGFELKLPEGAWNRKFLFLGVGGLAGTYTITSANPVDVASALGRGYATIVTDTGHQAGGTDASWALVKPGVANDAKVEDYLYRATHDVTVAGKDLVQRFYGTPIQYSYFDGCSNGGHQGLTEAADYPDDYNGIIAGAPFHDAHVLIASTRFQKQQLSSPAAYLPATKLPMIEAAITKSCDAADGVSDGLIQNPAQCSFDPKTLICKGEDATDCLTPPQADTLNAYFSAIRDSGGNLVYAGWSVAALAGGADVWSIGTTAPADFKANEPWGNAGFAPAPLAYQFADHFMKFMVEQQPEFNLRNFAVSADGIVAGGDLARFDERLGIARTPRPTAGFNPTAEDFAAFTGGKGKLILYHGLADPALPPFMTMRLYEQLAEKTPGGYDRLRRSARLFMVPDMQHCRGGPGPNVFDTLTALEQWVEQDHAPEAIEVAHHAGNNPAAPIDRGMKLCPFPQQAAYDGKGDVKATSSWSCTDNQKMLGVGANGHQAGL